MKITFVRFSILVLALASAVVSRSLADIGDTDLYLVIKGGVSLGSYETGLNRVLLKEAGKLGYRIKSFSGASAGSINGVLSVIESCIEDTTINFGRDTDNITLGDDPLANFMRHTWDLGIDQLAPDHGGTTDNIKEIAMFDRAAFNNKKQAIFTLLQRPARQCEMDLTMSVTKLTPLKTEIKSLGATIQQQRFIVPIKVSRDELSGKLVFRNNTQLLHPELDANGTANTRGGSRVNPNQDLIDQVPSQYIFLPENDDSQVDKEHIWNLALASSAFPVAFQPVELAVCFVKPQSHTRDKPYSCRGTNVQKHLFSDGGAFDNAPVGAALDLSRVAHNSNPDTVSSTLVYLNPDFYRGPRRQDEDEQISAPVGLASLARYFGDVALTAHEQEYTKAIQALKDRPDVKFESTSRFHHLLADFHAHFGAFYAADYRIHDYLVGMYDAYQFAALIQCKRRVADKSCVSDTLYKSLAGLKQDSVATPPATGQAKGAGVSANRGNRHARHAQQFGFAHRQFLLYLFSTEFPDSIHNRTTFHPPDNIYIALNQAFDNPSKSGSDEMTYTDYITRLEKTPGIDSLAQSGDIKKILNDGRAYTERKIRAMLDSLIALQEVTGRCYECQGDDCTNCANAACPDCNREKCSDACRTARFDKDIGTYLKTARPFIASSLSQHRTNIWPKSLIITPAFSLDLRYGFNAMQKNQVFSASARLTNDWLSDYRLSIDFGIDFNRFGSELSRDHYQSFHAGITWHTDDIRLSSVGLGIQRDGKGDRVYPDEHHLVYGTFSFLNELFALKLLYNPEGTAPSAVKSRDDFSLILSVDAVQTVRFLGNLLLN